jgi:hypothetical protein
VQLLLITEEAKQGSNEEQAGAIAGLFVLWTVSNLWD